MIIQPGYLWTCFLFVDNYKQKCTTYIFEICFDLTVILDVNTRQHLCGWSRDADYVCDMPMVGLMTLQWKVYMNDGAVCMGGIEVFSPIKCHFESSAILGQLSHSSKTITVAGPTILLGRGLMPRARDFALALLHTPPPFVFIDTEVGKVKVLTRFDF